MVYTEMDVAAGKLKCSTPCPRVLVYILFKRCPWGAAAAAAVALLRPERVYLPSAAAVARRGVIPPLPQQHQGILCQGGEKPFPGAARTSNPVQFRTLAEKNRMCG